MILQKEFINIFSFVSNFLHFFLSKNNNLVAEQKMCTTMSSAFGAYDWGSVFPKNLDTPASSRIRWFQIEVAALEK